MTDVRDGRIPSFPSSARSDATLATLDVRPGDLVDRLRDGMENRERNVAQADRFLRRFRICDLKF